MLLADRCTRPRPVAVYLNTAARSASDTVACLEMEGHLFTPMCYCSDSCLHLCHCGLHFPILPSRRGTRTTLCVHASAADTHFSKLKAEWKQVYMTISWDWKGVRVYRSRVAAVKEMSRAAPCIRSKGGRWFMLRCERIAPG